MIHSVLKIMNTRRIKIRLLILALLAFIAGLVVYRALSNDPSHFWWKLNGARVTYIGEPRNDVVIYRSFGGETLIILNEQSTISPTEMERWFYLVEPKYSAIANPNNASDFSLFGEYGFSIKAPVNYSILQNDIKFGVDPQLIIGRDFVEFTSIKKARVRVSW